MLLPVILINLLILPGMPFYDLPKQAVKKVLSKTPFTNYSKGNRYIFLYHDISNAQSPHHSQYYSTDTKTFKKHLEFFIEHFTILPLDKLLSENLPNNRNYAALSFDDGFSSVKEIAFPILKQVDITFSVFVNKYAILRNNLWFLTILNSPKTDYLMSVYLSLRKHNSDITLTFDEFCKEPFINVLNYFSIPLAEDILSFSPAPTYKLFMDEFDLKYLSDNGIEIGNHTVNQYNLSKCDDSTIIREIDENTIFLEDILQKRVNHLAIPFGKKEHYSKQLFKKHSNYYIYNTNPVPLPKKNNTNGFHLIPRIGLTNNTVDELTFFINRTFVKTINI